MEKHITKEELKSKVSDAKSEAYKLKSAEEVKAFMDANRSKITDVSKKLKGDAKKNFDKIIDVVNKYCSKVDEAKDTQLKLICGLVAVIMWLIGMSGAWIVAAASPVIGPLLVNVLKKVPGLSESNVDEGAVQGGGKYLYVTKNNPSFKGMVRKVGASGIKKLEDPYVAESLTQKLARYSTCVPYSFEKAYQLYIPIDADIRQLEQELFDLIVNMGGGRWNEGQKGAKELFSVDDDLMFKIIAKFIEDHPGVEER